MGEEEELHIARIITGFLQERLSADEFSELAAWLAAAPENRLFFERFTGTTELSEELGRFYRYDTAAGRKKIAAEFPGLARPAAKRARMKITMRWAAAAAVLIICGGIATYRLLQQDQQRPPVAQHLQDVAPGGYKATLTLADGKRIDLGKSANGELAEADGVAVQKTDSASVTYSGQGRTASLHTLSTPRGGQFYVKLPDGTGVWLNAASSITFPTAFTGNERKVAVTGEVYMEVARNEKKPFIVTMPKGNTLEVLGTAFNIQAYNDEPSIKTTLLSGRVRYNSGKGSVVLRPGQQVEVAGNDVPEVKEGTEDAIAWKNGTINLRNTDLASLSRQLARWYDIDVRLQSSTSRQLFGGVINRRAKLSTVMKALSLYGVQTKLENNVLIIE